MSDTANEITRTIAIEHKGEKIAIEVHVHLSQDEIERIICPVVGRWLGKQIRTGIPVGMDVSLPPGTLKFVNPDGSWGMAMTKGERTE